jgi:class 3 adenylate cyclase/tetratricopeptide (TPR) repeat protein
LSCPSCGTINPPLARFCHQCGTRLPAACPSCGHFNPPEARFCNACGARLAAGAEAGPTAEALQREEERRPVTILFADIVGFTTLADRLDPEEVRELTAIALGRLAREITTFGGTIDKFIGDAVLALFGAPIAHEDDAQRAVGAALAILRAVEELNESLALPSGLRLAIRVGINTGPVVVGGREVGGHHEYTAIGDAVNVAARLQNVAEPGAILVGESTFRGAGRAYAFLPLAPLTLRGKPEPVAAYRALGPLEVVEPLRLSAAGEREVTLVGREQELASLRYCLREAQRGNGQIAFVVGEAGLGKTRLVAELRREVAGQALRWAQARGVSYAQHLSYGIFNGTVRDLFRPDQYGGEEEAAAALRTYLADLDAEEAEPFLAYQLGLPRPAIYAELQQLSPSEFQARLTAGIRRWLSALAERQPLVFVVDDVHWADPSSLGLLDGLLDLTDEVPLFFCFLLRPERESLAWQLKERAARELPHRYSEVALRPLDEADGRELVGQLVRIPAGLHGLEEQILARTAGNPLFIEEVVRDLAERGALARSGDGLEAIREVAEVRLPDSLQSAIIARVDRLREPVRQVLQTAAVLGRSFSGPLLARVLEGHVTLEEDLREGLRLELIREVASQPERQYAFRHPLVQEAIYGTLLLRRRRELHETIARALEGLNAERLDEHLAALARHSAAAERWDRTLDYALREGDRAAAAHAPREALEHYRLAWRAAGELGPAVDDRQAAELLEKLGNLQLWLGLTDEAIDSYRDALARLGAGAEPALVGRVYLKLARASMLRQDPIATREYLDAAFAALPPDRPELSLAWSIRSWLQVWDTDYAGAAASGDRALALALEHGDFGGLTEAYVALTHPSVIALPGRDGARLLDEWLATARRRGDPYAVHRALATRVLTRLWMAGTVDAATIEAAREAVALADEVGVELGLRSARGLLGGCLLLLGRWDEALAEMLAAREGEGEFGPTEELVAYWLGLLYTERGQLERGRGVLEERLGSLGFPHSRIWLNQAYAANRQAAGDPAAARAALAAGAEAAARLACAPCQALFSGAAAEQWVGLGDLEAAEREIALAREVGGRLQRAPTLLAADRAEAAIAAARGDGERAIRLLRAALAVARGLGQPHEIARTELQLGQALGRSASPAERGRSIEHLRAALATMQRLGVAVAGPADAEVGAEAAAAGRPA